MYITIDDITKEINLQSPIDNSKSNKKIGLFRAYFIYTFYNVEKDEKIYLKNKQTIDVKMGSYTIDDIKRVSNNKVDFTKLTGKSIIDNSIERFDYYLNNILGIQNNNDVDTLQSKKSFTFSTNILSTSDNLHNGVPSNDLYTGFATKNISFGDVISFEPHNIQYKTLSNGIIDNIKVELLDANKNIINSKFPISIVLEVI